MGKPDPNPGGALTEARRATHAVSGGSRDGVAACAGIIARHDERAANPESAAAGASAACVEGSAAWCAAIGRGDQAAFAAFYEAWFDRCYAMARGLTRRDESFCLDVVQDAMLRVARRIPPMRDDAQVARWMVRVVHSAGVDLLRKESRARRRERAAARAEAGEERPGGASDVHAARWLHEAMAALEEHEQTLLSLRFGRGATLEAAGEAVGTTGDAAHGRLRRAVAKLRRIWPQAPVKRPDDGRAEDKEGQKAMKPSEGRL